MRKPTYLLAFREEGLKIDKSIITNDAEFQPPKEG